MADSTIGNLPTAESFTDNSLLVTEQAGSAKKLTGLLLKLFCQNAVQPHAAAAAESAEAAATSAEESAEDASLAEAAKLAAIAASGHYPYINSSNHHWMVWDVGASAYADTGINATGDTGAQGIQGEKGADGVSPTVATEAITGGTKVTITDKDGAHEFNVMDGENVDIVQTTGGSETAVMSQKVVTVEVNALKSDITDLQTALIGVSDLIGGDA